MNLAERRNCRQCGRPIIVTKDEHGQTVALDAEAEVYDLERDPDAGVEFALRSFVSHVTHFATCPVAMDQARRKEGS